MTELSGAAASGRQSTSSCDGAKVGSFMELMSRHAPTN
jgi:hypothetical protein